MVLLIDANIILDVLLNRQKFVKDSSVSDLTRAAEWNWDDFEYAVQSATAERVQADYIVTRNVKDFSRSKVIAFTPSELLTRI